jgi:prephenate dehydrogenase
MPNSSEPSDFHCPTLTIVGVGLIGGSLAAAVKERGLADRVIGVGRNPEKLKGAVDRGLLNEVTADLVAAARESSLLVFCTPVDRIVAGVREVASDCRCNTIITDVGSTKGEICAELASGLPPGVEFIGSHPLAGSEKSGYEYSDPKLFLDRVCVLTPVERTSTGGLQRLGNFWCRLGAKLVTMSPEASVLASTLSPEHRELAARGFRDTTRIAAGDADLWTSILMCNADQTCESLDKFARILDQYRDALKNRDAAALKRLLEHGKEIRDQLK